MAEQPTDDLLRARLLLTRRRFFAAGATGLGAGLSALALSQLLGCAHEEKAPLAGGPVALGPHFPPRAKRVIYMHMEGGPSQLDLFDHKPGLKAQFNKDLPDSVRMGQRLTGMTSGQKRFPSAPSIFKFSRHDNGGDGLWLSELLPETAKIAPEMLLIRSMHTEAINHEPAITFMQTGTQQPGRPSFGAWTSYGLGSANKDLPTFVVLISQGLGNMQALAARFWGSAFLPSEHQGCKLRSGADPVLHLSDPAGVARADRRRMLDMLLDLNEREYERSLDPEVRTRIAQFEMAYRMQMSVPELTDFKDESEETLALYGPDVRKPGTFAANCLLARRLAERGVRFIQLYMRGWDQHNNLPKEMQAQCGAVDRAQSALVQDLRRRGLLDDTLVLWGGEFGRTVYSQGELSDTNYGRDHHPRCFSMWLAGGGVRRGHVHGATDDFSYNIAESPVSVHDLHATLQHLLGFDHQRLGYRYLGRDMRLTDVFGEVRRELIA